MAPAPLAAPPAVAGSDSAPSLILLNTDSVKYHVVRFPHAEHAEYRNDITCETCHHPQAVDPAQRLCRECHPRVKGRMNTPEQRIFHGKRYEFPLPPHQVGVSCRGCHASPEIQAPNRCADCHARKGAE